MKKLQEIMSAIESMLETKMKRHIIGGLLISASFFLASLAFTTLSIKTEVIHG